MELNTVQLTVLLNLIQIISSVVISTSFGKLEGNEIGEFYTFKHVPFAKAPIGKLRFQKPETPAKWNGVRDAKEYGPACMSNSSITHSPQKWVDEDCLHLNIFTSRKCLESKDCAVIVYIHGGDLLFDSAVMFKDDFILDAFVKKDVILVIPAFRLGIFSHFTVFDQSIAPNNLAIYDFLKSLEFVKAEIRHFGGNNKRVTLFGHSYGGTLSTMMTFSPNINKDLSLFQQTISMSAHQYFETLDYHIEKTQRFAEYANCLAPTKMARTLTKNQQDSYTLKCLQNKSGMELLRIQRLLEDKGFPLYNNLILREPLFPNVKPSEFLDSPKMIPMLNGCTRIEFDHEPELIPLSVVFGFDNQEECEAKYRQDVKTGIFDRGNHTDKTQAILVPTKMRVNKLLEKGIPAYLYEYTYPKHARHSDDLYYFMGLHPFEEDENEVHLKEVYRNMFMNFAKYGYPGDGFEMADIEKSTYYDVNWNEKTGQRPQMKEGFENKVNDYWLKEMMEYDRSLTKKKKKLKTSEVRYFPFTVVDRYELSEPPYLLSCFLLIGLIFLTGYYTGRCYSSSKRNSYMKIDGSDYEKVKS